MSRQLAIFDLDGTLMDTAEGVLASVEYTLRHEGLPFPSREWALQFIGPPIQLGFRRALGVNADEATRLAAVFRSYYSTEALLLATPYPGIFDLLADCRAAGITTAVATYKREDYALRLLRHFGFDRYMRVMHGADSDGVLRKADIIRSCMRECGCTPSAAVMIGDSVNDAAGSEEAGVALIGVTYGFGFRTADDVAACANAVGAAATPAAVLELLKKDVTTP